MSSWTPSDVLAVLAVGSSLMALVVTTITQWSLAKRRHDHELQLERVKIAEGRITQRTERSTAAAQDLLVIVDSLRDLFQLKRSDGDGPTSAEMRPLYDDMRRRIPYILDAEARLSLEQAADVFYWWNDVSKFDGESHGRIAYIASKGARDVLGAVLRGEEVPETHKVAEMFAAHEELQRILTEQYEEHLEDIRRAESEK